MFAYLKTAGERGETMIRSVKNLKQMGKHSRLHGDPKALAKKEVKKKKSEKDKVGKRNVCVLLCALNNLFHKKGIYCILSLFWWVFSLQGMGAFQMELWAI